MCEHLNFKADVKVGRLSKEEGGPITHYTADIVIKCADCEAPFEFVGLPCGSSPYRPTVSIDGQELRCPIMPEGQTVPDGLPGFSVKMEETEQ